MKKPIILYTIMVLLMTSLLFVGCGSSVSSGLEGMMKRMPDSTIEFFVDNLKEGRSVGAAELSEGYGSYIEMWRENPLVRGITPDETDYLALFISDSPVYLFEGNFNLDNIRENLEESGMNSDEYRGVEIWKGEDIQGETHFESGLIDALVNDRLIIVGYEPGINDCIDVMNEGRASLWENSNFKDIVDRLPDGLTVKCSLYWEPLFEDIIVGGFSLMMNDDGTQDFTFVGKFISSEDASSGTDIILSDLADDFSFDPAIAEAIQDGKYLTITAEGQEIY